MKCKRIWHILFVFLIAAGSSYAESVYTWTDENGIRHYSNTGIPNDVEEADERPELIVPEVDRSPADAAVDNEVGPGLEGPQEDVAGKEPPETAIGETEDSRLAAKVAKERQMLLARIKRIENLAIGVSFTPGMKAARIAPLKERLALLDADPARYFRMKRQGAFGDDAEEEDFVTPAPEATGDSLTPIVPRAAAGPQGDQETAPSEEP